MGGACRVHAEGVECFETFVGRPEGMGSLGRPNCRWEDNIEMELGKCRGCGLDSPDLGYGHGGLLLTR
jgi:hypothetical protein